MKVDVQLRMLLRRMTEAEAAIEELRAAQRHLDSPVKTDEHPSTSAEVEKNASAAVNPANCLSRNDVKVRRVDKEAPERKQKWTGPVPPEVLEERRRKHTWRLRLSIEAGHSPFLRTFADRHNLTPSEVSRHTTGKPRGVAPGSATDLAITAALNQEIAELEALLAKRLGPRIISKLRGLMFPDNAQHGHRHGRRNTRVAAD
jgi:hypothetical protein